jgi:hypothetical protein
MLILFLFFNEVIILFYFPFCQSSGEFRRELMMALGSLKRKTIRTSDSNDDSDSNDSDPDNDSDSNDDSDPDNDLDSNGDSDPDKRSFT